MKTKTYQIPVGKDRISIMSDPTGQGHDTVHAYVKISDLPLDLPLDVNPRSQNTESRVARQIQKGLTDDASVFHLLNRGLTMTAKTAEYDKKSQSLAVELANGHYGLVDGGHTYSVIRKSLNAVKEAEERAHEAAIKAVKTVKDEEDSKTKTHEPVVQEIEEPEFLTNGFVRLEVMVGVKDDLLVDVARSRNTSAQVKDESLANLEGSFDWLKDALAKTPFGSEVAYRENEDDAQFPIDVREIIALLTLFHPNFQDSEKPPIMGYTSKGRCLELFRTEPDGFQALKPIIPDVLRLYDYIHVKFADLYREIGGLTGISEDKPKTQKGVKLAKVIGVKHVKEGFPLFYLGEKANFLFPDGWLLPVLSSLRSIVSYKATAKWKANPFKFFDATGKSLVAMTLEASQSMGRNPNAVGKSRPHWIQLHAHELNQYLKMLNVDMEQEVKFA